MMKTNAAIHNFFFYKNDFPKPIIFPFVLFAWFFAEVMDYGILSVVLSWMAKATLIMVGIIYFALFIVYVITRILNKRRGEPLCQKLKSVIK